MQSVRKKILKRLTNEEAVDKTPSIPIPTSETQDQQAAILRASHMKSSQTDSEVKTPRLNSKSNISLFTFSNKNLF
jgi:hypothetical protein